jgi:hypothetical protein
MIMNRNLALLAIAGAGAGFLLLSDQGRRWLGQAGQSLRAAWQRRTGVEAVVRDRLEHEPPDTAMVEAFHEAIA